MALIMLAIISGLHAIPRPQGETRYLLDFPDLMIVLDINRPQASYFCCHHGPAVPPQEMSSPICELSSMGCGGAAWLQTSQRKFQEVGKSHC